MELAKVSAKALHNVASENNYWSIDQIKKLDDILSSLGEELDSIMVILIKLMSFRMLQMTKS